MPLLGFVEICFLFVAGLDSDLGLAKEPSLLKWRSAWSSCWLSCIVSCFVPVPDGSAGRFRAATGTSVNCEFDGATTLMATSAVCWSSWVSSSTFSACSGAALMAVFPSILWCRCRLYKPVGKEKSALCVFCISVQEIEVLPHNQGQFILLWMGNDQQVIDLLLHFFGPLLIWQRFHCPREGLPSHCKMIDRCWLTADFSRTWLHWWARVLGRAGRCGTYQLL